MKWIHGREGRHMGVKTFYLQEIRQLKSNANVKMINKYLPHKDYQLSIDKRY
jgi:hypothetical protein